MGDLPGPEPRVAPGTAVSGPAAGPPASWGINVGPAPTSTATATLRFPMPSSPMWLVGEAPEHPHRPADCVQWVPSGSSEAGCSPQRPWPSQRRRCPPCCPPAPRPPALPEDLQVSRAGLGGPAVPRPSPHGGALSQGSCSPTSGRSKASPSVILKVPGATLDRSGKAGELTFPQFT